MGIESPTLGHREVFYLYSSSKYLGAVPTHMNSSGFWGIHNHFLALKL